MIKPIDSFDNHFSTNSSAGSSVNSTVSSYVRATQLTAAKPRCGLQSIGDLIPRLIRQYEIQAEMNEESGRVKPKRRAAHRTERTKSRISATTSRLNSKSAANSSGVNTRIDSTKKQATFAWYD